MSQRFEREIDEILRQFEGSPGGPPRPLRRPPRRSDPRQRLLQAFWSLYSLRWRWSSAEVMLVAFAAALIGLALVALVPILTLPVGWIVVALFVIGYLGGYRRWSRPAPSWRGRPISYGSQPGLASFWSELRNRWRRRRW
ncbi:MAG TPA: hypothetical protein VHL09_04615 [Dehalococcoidia bacterium]|nr:hypothetical protein [Dehalococcoidia bacterium]